MKKPLWCIDSLNSNWRAASAIVGGIGRPGVVDIRRGSDDGPDEGGDPADEGPAQKEVEQGDGHALVEVTVARDEGGKKVEREKEEKVEHRTVPPVRRRCCAPAFGARRSVPRRH